MDIAFFVPGILALAVAGGSLYMLSPRGGRPRHSFLATEFGAMTATLGVLFIAIFGIALIFMAMQ